jgi:hypothetical protein
MALEISELIPFEKIDIHCTLKRSRQDRASCNQSEWAERRHDRQKAEKVGASGDETEHTGIASGEPMESIESSKTDIGFDLPVN